MTRAIHSVYRDPLDEIWLAAAAKIGFVVTRSSEVYAATDGAGELVIATNETMDADDSLAQMIFHELCHSLVEGPEALKRVDWGLDNETDRDVPREHACLRLQATLAGEHGLRHMLAPTTEHRAFYDGLGDDPLAPGREPTSVLARHGLQRAAKAPWGPHLGEALAQTAAIVRITADAARARPDARSIYAGQQPVTAHPVGGIAAAKSGHGCADCAWRFEGRGAASRCRQHQDAKVDAAWPACTRWEPALDCQDCGACCREAYTAVDVKPREPAATKLAHLIVRDGRHRYLLRTDHGRCVALDGGHDATEKYACRVYDDRPRTCHDFENGSQNCLDARRAVGLSR